MKPAAERLAAAKTALAQANQWITELEARRRSALLMDADGAAAVADDELVEARARAKRLSDKIEWLLPACGLSVVRPLPVRKNVDTMEDLQEARRTLSQMEARGDRYSADFHWLNRQVEAVGPLIEEKARKGTL